MDGIRCIPQARTPALPCPALRKYETWTVYAAFRRRGRLRSHVGLCGNMKHGRCTLHSAGGDACAPMSTLRSHVGLCGNMKHGRCTLHSAGGDACAPMSRAPMPRVRYTYSVHCVPVSDIRPLTGRKDGCFIMALSLRDKLIETLVATSENLFFCWECGHHARIFQEDAGVPPAFPGVFGACLVFIRVHSWFQYVHAAAARRLAYAPGSHRIVTERACAFRPSSRAKASMDLHARSSASFEYWIKLDLRWK